jgi:hypothetical protein
LARYFFDIDAGTQRYDDELGTELADDQAARDEATRAMAEMAGDYLPGSTQAQQDITMWVRNEEGDTILQLALSFSIHQPNKR